MQANAVGRFLLTGVVAVIAVHLTWSNTFGLERACVEKNGTVCNRRPPEECNINRLEASSGRQRLAIDPEALFVVAVFVNHSSPTRQLYLYLQWIQYDSLQTDSVTVRVTSFLQGSLQLNQVICMTNLGNKNETNPRIHLSGSSSHTSRHSTMIPLTDNMTTTIVEINIDSNVYEYLVKTPKYSRHSWILQGVSVTTQGNKGYLSISSPHSPTRSSIHAYRILYIVTVVCHLYNETTHKVTAEKRSMKIVSQSPVTNCSNTNREIYMQYLPEAAKPLVFTMTRPAYSVVIDAQLVIGSSNQVMGEASVTTPIFVRVGGPGGMDNRITTKPTLEVSTVREDNSDNKLTASELSAVPSKSGETDSKDPSKVKWGIVAASVSLALVACLFVAWRCASKKCKSSTHQPQETSDKPTLYENNKSTSTKPLNAAVGLGVISRMSRLQSECCTNRVSDVPSIGDLSDPLISTSEAADEVLHFKYKLKKSHLTNHDILDGKDRFYKGDDASEWRYNHQLPALTKRKQKSTVIDDAVHDTENFFNTEPQTNMSHGYSSTHYLSHHPSALRPLGNSILPRKTDVKDGSNFMLSSRENSIWEGDDSDGEYFGQDVVRPELFSDHIDARIMREECLRINMEYDQITGLAGDLDNSESYETFIDDECFSISETIIC